MPLFILLTVLLLLVFGTVVGSVADTNSSAVTATLVLPSDVQPRQRYRDQSRVLYWDEVKKDTSLKRSNSGSKSNKGTPSYPIPTQVEVRVRDHYIAYFIPGLLHEPSYDIEKLRQNTEIYWTEFFYNYYATSDDGGIRYKGVKVGIADTKFGQESPVGDFYIEYDVNVLYGIGTAHPLDARESLGSMIFLSDQTRYVELFLRTIPTFSLTEFTVINTNGPLFPTFAPRTPFPTTVFTPVPTPPPQSTTLSPTATPVNSPTPTPAPTDTVTPAPTEADSGANIIVDASELDFSPPLPPSKPQMIKLEYNVFAHYRRPEDFSTGSQIASGGA